MHCNLFNLAELKPSNATTRTFAQDEKSNNKFFMCVTCRTRIHSENQKETNNLTRTSMVRLGAEKDVIDYNDWETVFAEETLKSAAPHARTVLFHSTPSKFNKVLG